RLCAEELLAGGVRRQAGRLPGDTGMSISVNIVACNEETRLRWCIENIRPYVDEVVVVVQQSEDRTLEVARELADVVVEHPCYEFAEPSRPAAHDATHGDWVLVLDADERLSDFGKANLLAWTADESTDFYGLRRLTLVDGAQLEDMVHPRLFRRNCVVVP